MTHELSSWSVLQVRTISLSLLINDDSQYDHRRHCHHAVSKFNLTAVKNASEGDMVLDEQFIQKCREVRRRIWLTSLPAFCSSCLHWLLLACYRIIAVSKPRGSSSSLNERPSTPSTKTAAAQLIRRRPVWDVIRNIC